MLSRRISGQLSAEATCLVLPPGRPPPLTWLVLPKTSYLEIKPKNETFSGLTGEVEAVGWSSVSGQRTGRQTGK